MRIGVMGRILDYEGYGIRTYLLGMLQGLKNSRTEHEIIVFVEPGQAPPEELHDAHITFKPISPNAGTAIGRLIWDHISIPAACRQFGIQVLFAPAHVRPFMAPCPTIVTVHDMLYHLYPKDWGWSDQMYFRLAVNSLTTKADAIMTYSENTRQDVHRILGYPSDQIKMIPPGVPAGFSPWELNDSTPILEKYGISRPFVLYVGSFHPRKNVSTILDAFDQVAGQVPHQLVIASLPIWNEYVTLERIEASPFRDRIHFTGYVPQNELPALYSQADLFVFPTKYEGFGFPALEALACGCPVVASNVSSLPEVCGEAAEYVSPGNAVELAGKMRTVLENPERMREMRQKSVRQAAQFKWEKSAFQLLALLTEVAS